MLHSERKIYVCSSCDQAQHLPHCLRKKAVCFKNRMNFPRKWLDRIWRQNNLTSGSVRQTEIVHPWAQITKSVCMRLFTVHHCYPIVIEEFACWLAGIRDLRASDLLSPGQRNSGRDSPSSIDNEALHAASSRHSERMRSFLKLLGVTQMPTSHLRYEIWTEDQKGFDFISHCIRAGIDLITYFPTPPQSTKKTHRFAAHPHCMHAGHWSLEGRSGSSEVAFRCHWTTQVASWKKNGNLHCKTTAIAPPECAWRFGAHGYGSHLCLEASMQTRWPGNSVSSGWPAARGAGE